MRIFNSSSAATAHHLQKSLPDNAGTSRSPSVAQHRPSPPPAPGLSQSTRARFMCMFNLAPKKKKPSFGPLTFLAQLESNMRKAGCSKRSITKFKTLFADPDPQSLYAQNILADLQANRYAPESVKRHITRMYDFRKKCYGQMKSQRLTSRNLTNLQTLSLRNNRLAALPGEIGQLPNLKALWLFENQLAALPGEIGQLTNLQTLWLYNNQLAALPDEIGQLANLQNLSLGNNRLAALPSEIGQLTNLQALSLNNNRLAALPDEIGQLTNLQTLSLEDNQLTALPGEIGQLTNLQTLWLNNNQLAALPSEIGQLTNLRTLVLHRNQLAALPGEIGQLTNLQTLWLYNNQLAALPGEIGQLTNLQTLKLHQNRLTALPSEIGQLTNLQTLSLEDNQLTALPSEIGQLTNLQALSLNNNQLTALPDEIVQLTNLRRLWLKNNQFTTVPRALLDFPEGTEINLQGNPLPEAEMMAVREEIRQRRERGQAVPQLILPAIAVDEEDALRAAAAGDLNVHERPLTDIFKQRLDELANQFPDNLKGTIAQQRAEIKTIEERLFGALERHAADHPDYSAARDVARIMFEKGYGQREAYFNEFRYSSGHVLSYVVLAMEAQWALTPVAQLDQARENGLKNLIYYLTEGSDACDTRHIEEVLQMVGRPLSQHAHVNSDAIGAAPVGLSAEQIRDATFPVAKRILLDIAQQNPGLADDALQEAFRTALTSAMHAEHPGVRTAQLNAYLDTDILPMWDTFKEVALESLSQPEEDKGSARSSFSAEEE